jgi:hypothetical protein
MTRSSSMFQRATKRKLKARIALDGPAGSGKSYTALRFAHALAGPSGRVAVIDTEYRSASKYTGEAPDGYPFTFDVCELEHYAPSTYTNVIREAGKAGYDVLVIDSLSHAWDGVGGALDQVDRKAAASRSGNSFAAWRDVTPMHREMVEAILACPAHVIVTMRSKMGYEMETDDKGKVKPVKIGLKPIQREGVEYEFDVVGDLDLDHMLLVSKSRCSALDGARAVKPGAAFIQPLIAWLSDGADVPVVAERRQPATQEATQEATQPAQQEVQQAPPPGRHGVRLSGKTAAGTAASADSDSPYSQPDTAPCGDEMASLIVGLAKKLDMPPEKLIEIRSAHGVAKLSEMPYHEAAVLLGKLDAMLGKSDCPF